MKRLIALTISLSLLGISLACLFPEHERRREQGPEERRDHMHEEHHDQGHAEGHER